MNQTDTELLLKIIGGRKRFTTADIIAYICTDPEGQLRRIILEDMAQNGTSEWNMNIATAFGDCIERDQELRDNQ